MSNPSRRCFRCQAEITKDSSYCVSCGCQNEDIIGKRATAEFARQNQVESLKNRIARLSCARLVGSPIRSLKSGR